jgi:hypothetical protein
MATYGHLTSKQHEEQVDGGADSGGIGSFAP